MLLFFRRIRTSIALEAEVERAVMVECVKTRPITKHNRARRHPNALPVVTNSTQSGGYLMSGWRVIMGVNEGRVLPCLVVEGWKRESALKWCLHDKEDPKSSRVFL